MSLHSKSPTAKEERVTGDNGNHTTQGVSTWLSPLDAFYIKRPEFVATPLGPVCVAAAEIADHIRVISKKRSAEQLQRVMAEQNERKKLEEKEKAEIKADEAAREKARIYREKQRQARALTVKKARNQVLTPIVSSRGATLIERPQDVLARMWRNYETGMARGHFRWDVKKTSWDEYVDEMKKRQDRMKKSVKHWEKGLRDGDNRWMDPNVTYPVRNSLHKMMEELYRITYHEGIPQFHDLRTLLPRIVPKQDKEMLPACVPCELKGIRCSRSKATVNKTCDQCQRNDVVCVAWVEARRKLDQPAEMFGMPMKLAKELRECRRLEVGTLAYEAVLEKAARFTEKLRRERYEKVRWIGGGRGFVSVDEQRDVWALPPWEIDEDGKKVARRVR